MAEKRETAMQVISNSNSVGARSFEGQVFGELTLLCVRKDEKGNTRCLCRCSCGREKEVYLSDLTSGRTKSCGDMVHQRDSRRKNLAGRRFGLLTALEPTDERRYGSVVWKCRCDCGRDCKVSQRDLESGRRVNCGCMKSKKGIEFTDLTGKRFGKLTAVSKTDQRSSKGCVIWKCRCDCGNTVYASSENLTSGNQRSCGCLRKVKLREARQNLHFIDGTCIEWLECRKDRVDNTSGHTGVSLRKNGMYMAKIGFQNRQYYLGTYRNMEEAVDARRRAEALLFHRFLNEYHRWEADGGGEVFHFDADAVIASLSDLKKMES